jgi:two-component system NtrC family sensor kinase
MTVANQYIETTLKKRVKELACIYQISQLVQRHDLSLKETLNRVVNTLPSGWQYTEITHSQIVLDGLEYKTPGFRQTECKQTADVIVDNTRRGTVQVVYTEAKPIQDEGPFLNEERELLIAIAQQVGAIVEHRQCLSNTKKLRQQLHHADRLATIGQLAAAVAHELNEPLADILGFAQLALKETKLPDQVQTDLTKIVDSSLFAREVIQNLLTFARQTPPSKTAVNLRETISSALSLVKRRFDDKDIKLHTEFDADIAEINADRAQIIQVIVNLAVNAVHAMPSGGKFSVTTSLRGENVQLVIEDTGIGMSEEVQKQIFQPFFTTKDVDHGTGLGLAVVQDIITTHGGTIKVESEVNQGTRFTITLPVRSSTPEKDE